MRMKVGVDGSSPGGQAAGEWTRRRFIGDVLRWGLGSVACGSALISCEYECSAPIGWIPSVLAPVFYGYEELDSGQGAPARLRVFYPSLEGFTLNAPMLTCIGYYPLVVFLHGECDEADHYKKWFQLPAVLARSGFVVVVPELGWGSLDYPWASNSAQYSTALNVIDWMRSSWTGRDWLSGSSTLGLVGHSWGALLAGRLSLDIPNSAIVSIGGGWAEWPSTTPVPIDSLGTPSLFLFGTADTYANLQPASSWSSVPSPTHRVIFDGGTHWDYLDTQSACDTSNGPCDLVHSLTADLTALYLSKRMRVLSIPDSLEPPAFSLSADQIFYAGGHLSSFDSLPGSGCGVTIEWSTPLASSVILPWP